MVQVGQSKIADAIKAGIRDTVSVVAARGTHLKRLTAVSNPQMGSVLGHILTGLQYMVVRVVSSVPLS